MTSDVRPPSFVHDLNTCVGCQACVIACANENQLEPGVFWRQIVTFNEPRHPALPVFHLSLACNHCLDAPCLRYCPANAIARDSGTGAVVIDGESCIGCRYCSWVCSYDAPQFNARRGVMEKCTLCTHRLAEGLQPACTSLCPTGALRLGTYSENGAPDTPGFPDAGIRPAIRFISLRRMPLVPEVAPREPTGDASLDRGGPAVIGATPPPARKITFRSEWTLAVFTFLAIVLVGWFSASLIGGPRVYPAVFLAAGFSGIVLSSLHLGRRGRAWRAMLNWRRSWLNREVMTYPLFLGVAGLSFAVDASAWPIGPVAAVAGLACLVCIDRVYVVMARERQSMLDQVNALMSAVFLVGVFAGRPALFLPLGGLRLVGYIARRRLDPGRALGGASQAVAALRITLGFLIPLGLWLTGRQDLTMAAVASVVVGELIDRCDFYDALDVVTPRGRMASDLLAQLDASSATRDSN